MNLRIRHRTCYRYASPVNFGQHCLLVRPRQYHDLKLKHFSLHISPEHTLWWKRDLHENNVGILDLCGPSAELLVEMESLVEIEEENPFNFILSPQASEFPFEYPHDIAAEIQGLIRPCFPRDSERIRQWLHPIWHPGTRIETLALLQHLNKTIYCEIQYERRERKGVQTPAETLERKKGACRDFATLFMEACRLLGLAARFVSGYMYSESISGRMSMHGWAEVFVPGAGWLSFDPSWGILCTSFYIPVAVSAHPEHVPPISGTFFGFKKDYLGTDVDLFVERVSEDSRESARDSDRSGSQTSSLDDSRLRG